MSAQPARAGFGIGEVLDQLRAEFPDVSVSKIRFLESEGLIQPARSPSRYRRFSPADVERLRYILTAQRDEYLPLRVIKDRLAAADGQDGPGGGPAAAASRRPLSRRELLEAAGIDDGYLAELESFGLVQAAGRLYGPDALDAVRIIADLGRYGVHPRHLRVVRAAVDRETTLIEQVVAPTLRQRSAGSRDRARQTAREIAALSGPLHAALLDRALAEAGLAPGPAGAAGDGPSSAAGDGRPGAAADGPPGAGYHRPGHPRTRFPDAGFAGPAAAGSGA
jgi:DNA-binding transcriptional MerR regulator